MQVANEILRQLGGSYFLRITGAKNLIGSDNALSMQLPRGARGNGFKITLMPDDTYKLTLNKFSKLKLTTLRTCENVYCENLLDMFEDMTGLYATLNKRS